MERIGIIGVGKLAAALVDGLCEGVAEPPEVFLSPRGAGTARELAARHASVRVCADNQQVVDRCDLLVVSVRRAQRQEALAGLVVPAGRTVVNVMSGVSNDELHQLLGEDVALVRAIPLPSVRRRRSVTVTHPAHPVVDALFARLGGAQPVADEADFDVLSALTGTQTTHYAYLATVTRWAVGHGIPAEAAERYVRSLFQEVGRSLEDPSHSFEQLGGEHESPKGNNERVRTTWFDAANSAALTRTLDELLADLRKP
ncbi:NAD(P)-binding domain-containing protein [Streptomyces sp. Da 82-17]|uniref:NAD(P)-binding domain-containing protein n=1 Tax=Streptomyces sp. Da 82-17 TaxID=3377116 RepID=UPI0038D509F5